MDGKHEFKMTHYNQLQIDCESKGWEVHPLCVEVGCRGHAAEPLQYMSRVLGFTRQEAEEHKYEVEQKALYCSYGIVLARYESVWHPKGLLDVSRWT